MRGKEVECQRPVVFDGNAKPENKLRIRSAEELSLQMDGLLALAEVLNKCLDQWYLSGGTLLGAYRDGDFIPWDWDVEVTVLTEEARNKESVLLSELIASGFKISNLDSSYENFKIAALGWGTEYEILGRFLSDGGASRERSSTKIPAPLFSSGAIINFRGHDFPAPSPIEDYLIALYGSWWIPVKSVDSARYYSDAAYKIRKNQKVIHQMRKIMQLLLPPMVKEFPRIEGAVLENFQSWDQDLGWCNQPNITKTDSSDRIRKEKNQITGLPLFSTDGWGSRICKNPNEVCEITFYGDSYCMCRDVQDEETFPWYLGELRGTRVSNYGTGNYGLDQALLRLRRDYQNDPGKTVVLAVTSITMARCVSVYRHYLEPGNIFAIKPRFSLTGDGSLQTVEYPLSRKQDLLKLAQYKAFFRRNDEHYYFWRKSRFDYYTRQLPKKIAARFGMGAAPAPYKTFEYEIGFWQRKEDLFLGMMAYYQQLAEEYGFKPVFLLQHHKRGLEYLKGKQSNRLSWASVLSKAGEKFPAITFLDEADIFAENDDIDALYSRSYHSPLANQMIADYLNRVIR